MALKETVGTVRVYFIWVLARLVVRWRYPPKVACKVVASSNLGPSGDHGLDGAQVAHGAPGWRGRCRVPRPHPIATGVVGTSVGAALVARARPWWGDSLTGAAGDGQKRGGLRLSQRSAPECERSNASRSPPLTILTQGVSICLCPCGRLSAPIRKRCSAAIVSSGL